MKKAILKNKFKNMRMFGIKNLRLKLIYSLVVLLVIAGIIFYLCCGNGSETELDVADVAEELDDENLSPEDDEESFEEEVKQEIAADEDEKEIIEEEPSISELFGDESMDGEFPEKCQIQIRDAKHDLTKLYAVRDEAQSELDTVKKEYDRALDNVKEAQEDIEEERENLDDVRDSCRKKGSPW